MIDPGVQAPTGDPGAVAAAAGWHDGLADYFESTANTISYTVGSLAGTNWDGEAAQSYSELGGLVAEHFLKAGSTARTAAQALRSYAQQLDQFQRQGVHAVDQVVHWMGQLQKDQAALVKAQQAVQAAQRALDTATTTLNHAATGLMPGGAVAAAARVYGEAQSALTLAQTAERTAQRAVDNDNHQIHYWQGQARQIWQEAQNAAAVATGSLAPLEVAPPPLAGAPASFLDVLAADSPFLASHPSLAQPLAEQIAQANARRQHLGSSAVSHDAQTILSALDSGQNLSAVKLSVHHSGGGFFSGLLAAGAVVGTEILGGGPEDPAADAAAAGEEAAIEGGGDAAAAAAASAGDVAEAAAADASQAESSITDLPAGRSPGVYTVSSSDDLQALYDDLSVGGQPVENSYPGEMVELPDGTTVGLRAASKSGGPTLDVKLPNGTQLKVHVTP
jgi:hypothetical protein